ncbi:MAG: hypothetical protein AAF579_23455 [Cyanobacteria bacterium P01_C01_bin.118]
MLRLAWTPLAAWPFRDEDVRKAEQWILERQEVTGDWGGIIPTITCAFHILLVCEFARWPSSGPSLVNNLGKPTEYTPN